MAMMTAMLIMMMIDGDDDDYGDDYHIFPATYYHIQWSTGYFRTRGDYPF
jgi:hypothetical protein